MTPDQFDAWVEKVHADMTTIWEICHIPTPQGMKAYTHFQRDFDQIRAITSQYLTERTEWAPRNTIQIPDGGRS